MKTKLFLCALLVTVALSVSAQTNSYQNYLDKAMVSLENGDCDAAKKWYNVYKELTSKSISSVELLIQDCKSIPSSDSAKVKYAINDKIKIGDYLYRVAYVEDDGAHGFAIYDLGAGTIGGNNERYISDRKLPTRAEMSIIASNADKLILRKDLYYWTLDRGYDSIHYYVYRLSDGSTRVREIYNSHGRILIHRF